MEYKSKRKSNRMQNENFLFIKKKIKKIFCEEKEKI